MVTPRQLEIYDFVRETLTSEGQAPTIAEISAHFGLKSTSTIHQALSALEQKGLIRRIPNVSCGISLTEEHKQVSPRNTIPLLGVVAAGRPIEAVLSNESVCIPNDMALSTRAFALRVRGDSMVDEQICDGDYIIVESRDKAKNGQTVVALIDGSEATVKRFFGELDRVRLEPANPSHEAMIVAPPDRLAIQGIVIGVMRKLRN
ncbi:MAG TPA: transcriptional repressor LexA [Blastocatellia bacterium]